MALDFQAIGLMARSIDDVEMLLSAVAGPDARDPASLSLTHSSLPERCRIGWFDSVLEDGSDTEVSDSVREMAGALAEAGHQVARVPAPYDLNLLRSAWSVISAVGAARVAENHPDWSERLTAPMVALVEQGRGIPATHYVKALDRLQTFRAETSERWGDYDLILSPTTPAPAWPHGLEAPAVIGGVPGSSDLQHMFCGWVNAMGYGAISVPSRPHPDGRPIGVQLVARAPHWRDMMLVARRVEELSGWKLALPEIALK
jgi:aspartyl-tRNA(Asn)/glutamyl-tRNA(Gln) amidotransferase subunit A